MTDETGPTTHDPRGAQNRRYPAWHEMMRSHPGHWMAWPGSVKAGANLRRQGYQVSIITDAGVSTLYAMWPKIASHSQKTER